MIHIDVDADVYEEMKRHAEPFESPNDMLRRLLLNLAGIAALSQNSQISASSLNPSAAQDGAKGKLLPLIDAGLVQPGDQLRFEQVRRGHVFEGHVSVRGQIVTAKGTHASPSPALAELTGSQINGWSNWVHVQSGKTLHALKKEC